MFKEKFYSAVQRYIHKKQMISFYSLQGFWIFIYVTNSFVLATVYLERLKGDKSLARCLTKLYDAFPVLEIMGLISKYFYCYIL